VDEPAALPVEGLDPEAVLSVEEAGNQETALPPQLAVRLGSQDRRCDRHPLAARRLQSNCESFALLRRACDRADERVPVSVGREVDQDAPDGGGRRVDLDCCLYLSQGLSVCQPASSGT
jgi:hypothetical protein